jgi:hypothetical protein
MQNKYNDIPAKCPKCEGGPWTEPLYRPGQNGWYLGDDNFNSSALVYTCIRCRYELYTDVADMAEENAMRARWKQEYEWASLSDLERFYRTVCVR